MTELTWTERRVALSRPLTTERFGKGEVIATELVFFEPDVIAIEEINALDLKDGDLSTAQVLQIATVLCGVPSDDLARLSATDVVAVGEAVGAMLMLMQGGTDGGDAEAGEDPAGADGGSSSA